MIGKLALTLAALLTTAGLTLGPTETAAAETPTCAVPAGMVHNDPQGTTAQRYIWHNLITCMINATPPGAAITISAFSWSHAPSAQALLEADRRGVKVRLAFWTGRPDLFGFATELNDGKTPGSWYKACSNSCLGSNTSRIPSVHHSKIYLFSKVNTPTGPLSWVSTLGTGNLSGSAASSSYNTWRIIPNSQPFHDQLAARVVRMRTDKPYLPDPAERVTVGGPTMIHLFPQKEATPDIWVDHLKATPCPAKIRMAMYHWTSGRLSIANALASRKRAGCDVRVILNLDSALLDEDVLSVLMNARIPVYNAYLNGHYLHAKDLYLGTRNVVLTGSQNATRNAIYAGDESQIQIKSASVTAQYLAMWDFWVSRSVRVTSAMVAAPEARTLDTDGSDIRIPTSNDPKIRPENQ